MTDSAHRPWRKKKRWAAALALLAAMWYPLSAGPSGYAVGRGWMSDETFTAFYQPLDRFFLRSWLQGTFAESGMRDYVRWAVDLGLQARPRASE
jgi:hypothetical protein